MIPRLLLLAALLPGCILPGCTLVDQRTFNPAAGQAPVVAARLAPPPVEPGPPPLLTLTLPGNHDDAIRQAVAAARARKPDVVFEVVAAVPPDGVPSIEEAAAANADAVARSITAAGVPSARVRLLARPTPGADPQTVRVFVR